MRHKRITFIGAIIGIALVAPTVPAVAGTEDCMKGYACQWTGLNYDGSGYGSAREYGLWSPRNVARSVAANGGECKETWFYKSWNFSTGYPYGDYFRLNSKSLTGTNFRDPDLRNGAGKTPSGQLDTNNWDQTLEAHWFKAC